MKHKHLRVEFTRELHSYLKANDFAYIKVLGDKGINKKNNNTIFLLEAWSGDPGEKSVYPIDDSDILEMTHPEWLIEFWCKIPEQLAISFLAAHPVPKYF